MKGELGSNKFFINFAETKRFTKTLEECKTEKDFLFYWFLHGWEFKKGSTPTEFSTMPRILELIKASEVAAFSPEKKLKYDNEMMTELDKINYEREQKKLLLEQGFNEGHESGFTEGHESGFTEGHESGFTEGHESGFTEGITEGKLEIARTMKAEGLPSDVIVKCTGIDEETVLNL